MCGDMKIDLSECADCTHLYWDALSNECPNCGCPYVTVYTSDIEFEPDENFDVTMLLDPDLLNKIRSCFK